jgi:hypothetical protein
LLVSMSASVRTSASSSRGRWSSQSGHMRSSPECGSGTTVASSSTDSLARAKLRVARASRVRVRARVSASARVHHHAVPVRRVALARAKAGVRAPVYNGVDVGGTLADVDDHSCVEACVIDGQQRRSGKVDGLQSQRKEEVGPLGSE